MIGHIVERFIIHMFSAMGLVVGVFFGLQSLNRRQKMNGWMPSNIGGRLVLAGLLVFGVTAMREAYDVAVGGQPLIKAFTDYASWLIGLTLGVWAAYRLIWLQWKD